MARTKQTARKTVIPQELSSSSSETEAVARLTRRAGKEPARGSPSRRDEGQSPGLKWKREDILARLETVTFTPTRYPDWDFLKKTKLLDDATAMFDEMSLRKFMRIPHDTYEDMVKEFFSTLVIHLNDPEVDSERRDMDSYMEFTMAGQNYMVSCPELTTIYGFSGGHQHGVQVDKTDHKRLWKVISHGSFRGGVSKSSRIHHPTIRYVHKALTHTFYARKDGDSITEPEMNLLLLGLKPFFEEEEEGQRLHVTRAHVSFRAMFIKMLGGIQEWVMYTRAAKPTLTMGGLLTPLFLFKKIELRGIRLPYTLMDPPYLRKIDFLSGKLEGDYVYRFLDRNEELIEILLPEVGYTTLQLPRNATFDLPDDVIYDEVAHGPIAPISYKSRRIRHPASTSEAGPSSAAPRRSARGSARYDFEPYDRPINSLALRTAHEQIHILQRFIKWQGRSLRKVVDKVKELKSDMKHLKKKISGQATSSSQMAAESDSATNQPMDTEEDSSSHSHHRRGKRPAARSPTPTSSNESYSLSSSSN